MNLPHRELSPSEVRCILTLLTLGRQFNTKPVLDTHPIEDKWEGALPDFSAKELRHVLNSLGVRKWDWEWNKFHYSTKSGPNGQALASSKHDLSVLPEQLKEDIQLVGGRYIRWAMQDLEDRSNYLINLWYQVFPRPNKKICRKLSYFSDREGKTRVIAILDYWSQTVLKPLHDRVNSILRGIKTDCTYNQDHFKTVLPSTGPYHSLDLSNATDRMPIALQKVILSYIVGEEKTEAWARILTKWGYHTGTTEVFYNTGQPMGAYSSWPIMALTHHFIVRLAALKCGYPHFTGYSLLGDDLVIANDKVAQSYRELLSTLAMPISEAKTHVSVDTYEFAKRWIQKGVEVTPFALNGLNETWKRYYLFSNFIQNQQLHGWLTETGDPELIYETMLKIKGKYRQVQSLIKLYKVFTLTQLVLTKRVEAAAIELSSVLALPLPERQDPCQFIIDLVTITLKKQCEVEEQKLLGSKADFVIKIRDGLKEFVPDLQLLQTVRRALSESSPILGVINFLQIENTHTLMKLKSGTPEEILEVILSKDLIGTSINLELFQMRSAKSRIVSASTCIKPLIKDWQNYLEQDNDVNSYQGYTEDGPVKDY